MSKVFNALAAAKSRLDGLNAALALCDSDQEVVDRAYAELFRAIDTKDDLMTQIRCTLEYGEAFEPGMVEFGAVQKHVEAREAELKTIVKNVGVQIECLKNLLEHGIMTEREARIAAQSMPMMDTFFSSSASINPTLSCGCSLK